MDIDVSAAYATVQNLPLSEEGKDLAMILVEAGLDVDELPLSEIQLRDIFLDVFGGAYSSGAGKNAEIGKYERFIEDRKSRQGFPLKAFDPTNDTRVIKNHLTNFLNK